MRKRPLVFIVDREEYRRLAGLRAAVQHHRCLRGREENRFDDASQRGHVKGIVRHVEPRNRLTMLHQQHRREKCRTGRLRDGETIPAKIARLDVHDAARNRVQDEVSGVAPAFADRDRSVERPFERDRLHRCLVA